MNLRNRLGVLLGLILLAHPAQLLAEGNAPRLGGTAAAAVGVGFEVSHGDYGAGADATLVSLPLSFFFSPTNKLEIALEVPLLYLSSKASSGVVVTRSGGAGRGRGANRPGAATAGTTTVEASGLGDINVTAGWTLLADGEGLPQVRPIFYVKAPSGDLDRGLGTGTLEAGPGLAVSKWFGKFQLFGEGAYVFQNSRSDYPGRNYLRYLGGAGIQATDRLFVSTFAKGSSSRSEGAASQAEGRLKLSFMNSRRLSWELYGAVGFTDASPDYGGGMMLFYQF